jgi:hypothetical protein
MIAVMSIYLDDDPADFTGGDLAAVLEQASDRLAESGRLVVEVQRDGKTLSAADLDEQQNTLIGDSDWRLYSVDPRELAVQTLEQVAQRLDEARLAQAEAAELFQEDRAAEALKQITDAIDAWQESQQAVRQTAALVGIELDGRCVDGQPVEQIINLMVDQLKELRDLLTAGDTVALADALAYEWPQTIDRWQALVGQMIEWVADA